MSCKFFALFYQTLLGRNINKHNNDNERRARPTILSSSQGGAHLAVVPIKIPRLSFDGLSTINDDGRKVTAVIVIVGGVASATTLYKFNL